MVAQPFKGDREYAVIVQNLCYREISGVILYVCIRLGERVREQISIGGYLPTNHRCTS